MLFKTASGSTKDVDLTKRVVTGFFSDFDTLDSHGDIIRKGAYAKTIKEWGPEGKNRIWHLDQHRVDQRINKPLLLEERDKGLYFETKFPETQLATDLLVLYQEGAISEHSVGIDTVQSAPTELETEADGTVQARELTELRLYEGSTVTWGANMNTPATGVKSPDDPAALKDHISILRSCLSEGVSDAMAQRLELAINVMEADLGVKQAEDDYRQKRSAENINWRAVDAAIDTLQQAKRKALARQEDAAMMSLDSGDGAGTSSKSEPHEGEELLKHFTERINSN